MLNPTYEKAVADVRTKPQFRFSLQLCREMKIFSSSLPGCLINIWNWNRMAHNEKNGAEDNGRII
jgi:hypothetical protein